MKQELRMKLEIKMKFLIFFWKQHRLDNDKKKATIGR